MEALSSKVTRQEEESPHEKCLVHAIECRKTKSKGREAARLEFPVPDSTIRDGGVMDYYETCEENADIVEISSFSLTIKACLYVPLLL
jgi:hypothetical protein